MTKRFDLWHDFDRLMPPGMTFNRIWGTFLSTLVLGICIWWAGLFGFIGELDSILINYAQGVYNSFPPSDISTVNELMHLTVLCFAVGALLQLSFAVPGYQYYFKDSKAVYLMRRIDDPWLIHKQSWRVPLMGCVGLLLCLAVLYGLFCVIYFWAVPAESLPTQTIAFFWRYVS